MAVVVEVDGNDEDRDVTIAFLDQLEAKTDGDSNVHPAALSTFCEKSGTKTFSYQHDELRFEPQY